MAYSKKEWQDRVSEYPMRRTLTDEDSQTTIVTVARNEGTISQEGDVFNAETMNDFEDRIENGFNDNQDEINAINSRTSNVENKSSAMIRSELTSANVTTALGYTPPTQDTTYSNATTSQSGLMSATDKAKLDGIASSAKNTRVKGSAENSYRTGDVNITKANIGILSGTGNPSSNMGSNGDIYIQY